MWERGQGSALGADGIMGNVGLARRPTPQIYITRSSITQQSDDSIGNISHILVVLVTLSSHFDQKIRGTSFPPSLLTDDPWRSPPPAGSGAGWKHDSWTGTGPGASAPAQVHEGDLIRIVPPTNAPSSPRTPSPGPRPPAHEYSVAADFGDPCDVVAR